MVRGILLVAGDLVWLDSIRVDSATLKLNLLGQELGNDTKIIVLIFRDTFPIVFIPVEMDKFVPLPFDKTERAGTIG